MKRRFICSMGAAMILSSTVPAFAAEEVVMGEPMSVEYGVEVNASGTEMKETVAVYSDGTNATVSLDMIMNTEGEEVTISMPEYAKVIGETVYLNAESIVGAVGEAAGMDGLLGMLEPFGVTEQWIEAPAIDLSKIEFSTEPLNVEFPEFNEEMLADLEPVLMSAFTIDASGEQVAYVINNDTVAAASEAFDTFKADHLGFVGEILTYVQGILSDADSLDVKPAIREYLDAAAEGYMEADSSVTEETAKEMIDGTVDSLVSYVISSYTEEIKKLDLAGMWESTSLKSLIETALSGNEFEIRLYLGDEIGFDITVNGEVTSGTIEVADNGFVVTFTQDEKTVGTLEFTFDGQEFTAVLTDVENSKEIMTVSGKSVIDGNNMDLSFAVATSVDEEDATMTGYLKTADWDGTIEAPESSCSLLDVVKKATAMLLAPSAE